MTDALRLGRRAFTVAVVGATIAWSIGLSAVIQPLTAHGAAAGDLIKGSLPAVYYYGGDGQRYVFPNEKTFKTWYSDFSGVVKLSDEEIAAIPIGGNVVYRGGTQLIKIQTDPRVYAVEPSGVIRWVESEAVASALYGANWAARVHDVPDVFFVDYTPGASLASASTYPAGSLVSSTTSDSVYYVDTDGSKRLVDSAGLTANRFFSSNVFETSQNLTAYTDGASITAKVSTLVDASQTGVTGGDTGGTVAGGLTVALASDTPTSVTLALGASSVSLLGLNLTAAGGDVTVSSMTFKRFGVGAVTDWANLYLYNNGSRLTDGRTVNSQTHEVVFSGLSLPVASGSVVKLTLKGDVATGAGANTHGFQLVSASGVTSTASAVNGSFPISGNQMVIGSAQAGTVTLVATGTIPNPTLGQEQAEIGRFTMAAATEDASVSSIIFRLDGSVRGADLSNFTLKQGSTVLAETAATSSDGKYVVMSLSPAYSLANGFTRTFNLYADVGGDASRTIGVRVEYAADVVASGSSFGQGMRAVVSGYNGGTSSDTTRAACSATGQDCSWSTVQGSALTFAFNGPVATNVVSNSQDNVFMKFSITAQQYTRIDEFGVIVRCDSTSASGCDTTADAGDLINAAASEAYLKDIKIRQAGGGTKMGPQELTVSGSDITQTLTFTEDLTLQAGETIDLEITADVDNDVVAADVYEVVLDVSTIVAEDANGDSVAAANIVPSADMVGNNMTARAAALTVTYSVPPSDGASQTTIQGTSGKDSVGFSFAAGQGSAITVNGITLSTYVDGDTADVNDFIEGTETETDSGLIAARDIISSVSIYDADTGALIAGPKTVRSSPDGNVVFDNFTWVIGSGQTKKMVARANIAKYTVAGTNDSYAFYLDATTDITAQDADGSTVAATIPTNNGSSGAAPTTFIRVANAGTLNSSLDADAPRADIVLAGATDVVMSKVRFDAVNEGFLITRFQIDEIGAGTTNGLTAGDYDNNVSAVKISYPMQDGTTGTATSWLVGGTADFTLDATANKQIYIEKNKSAVVTVMASFQTIDNGATRGEKPQLRFDADGTFEATGYSSGTTITATSNTTNADGRMMVLHETQPTLSLAAGSPTTGIAGLTEVLRFTVAASAGEAVVLDKITFKMTATDNNGAGTDGAAGEWYNCVTAATSGQLDTGDFTLYDRAAPSTALEAADSEWTLLDTGANSCSNDAERVGFARLDLATPVLIAAGTTKTFSLEVDTTGASTSNDDTVRFEIPADLLSSTFIDSTLNLGAAVTTTSATSLTADASVGSLLVVGDYICVSAGDTTCDSGEEIMYVTGISGTTVTVFRGDYGRAQLASIANAANILRMPGSIVWDDDGDSSTVNSVSSYLLDNLSVVGSTFVY